MAAAVSRAVDDTRNRLVVEAVEAIQARYDGLTHVELSLALGVFTPARGAPGTALVSRWVKGYDQPGAEQLVQLLMLADGRLELREVGRDGRRRLYEVVVPGG